MDVKYPLRKVNFTFEVNELRNRIKDLRLVYDLTQDELAEKLEVSRQTIISLEKGRYNPSLILAYKISRVFMCRIEDVFIFEEGNENG
ncbi:putative transcriptional regulator [Ureibacillus xyleni]|uniref:Putative transcriptional regulator n=1 Tax=Ureibacillus xyleni TaxID=614648 RepID=A0A285RBH4_9BACL|nr:putative transcriptional regulator [Ureibacillus xyleni]